MSVSDAGRWGEGELPPPIPVLHSTHYMYIYINIDKKYHIYHTLSSLPPTHIHFSFSSWPPRIDREVGEMLKGSEMTSTSCKLERKTVERNRRMHMKSLCHKLASLLPRDTMAPKDAQTQQDHLDQAAAYIRDLQKRVEDLRSRKATAGGHDGGLKLPVVEIRDMESSLEVVLICEPDPKNSALFYDAIVVLEEEGAEVVNASFSTVGDRVFYTIHSQVTFARIGLEISRVSERLRQLIH